MKILCLSNFYPPVGRGGYEQWCQEIADGLVTRGHEVTVVTSDFNRAEARDAAPGWVHRDLHLDMDIASLRNVGQFFLSRQTRENDNLSAIEGHVRRSEPDVILIWGMWNVHRSLSALAEKLLPGRVVYYMADYWPTLPSPFQEYWAAPARKLTTRWLKALLRPIAQQMLAREERSTLQYEHVLFPTAFMQEECGRRGITPRHTRVIYGAIDTSPYKDLKHTPRQGRGLSLLHVGRLCEEKGVHTAIEALGHLRGQPVILTIVGDGEPAYEMRLHHLARKAHVESQVKFIRAQPKERLPALYQQADVFLFTSIWPEPFGRVIVEAMASGVTVIGTATGGAAEILSDNENALLYAAGDSHGLAEQIRKVIDSPELCERLSASGRVTAITRFDIRRMTSGIEEYLQALVLQ